MTRRLAASGLRPVTVGTFFSLGHSTYAFDFRAATSVRRIPSRYDLSIQVLTPGSPVLSLLRPLWLPRQLQPSVRDLALLAEWEESSALRSLPVS